MRDSIIIAKMKMIEAGIVPAMTGNQLTEMIKSLSSEEKATAKRKFRKIWPLGGSQGVTTMVVS